jgi:glycosyltransferase involved in cell wall biosynthesis
METQLQVWKARGVGIAYVVYDLIPLRHPEWLPDFIAQAFEHWLPAIARQADLLVGISAAVAQDLRDWLREPRQAAGRVPFMPAVDHFRLGADLDGQPAPAEATPPALQALAAAMAQQPTLLMVGTLEPRKGYAQALAAFEALWAQGETLNLVIVGKPGWGVEALIEQLRQHPQAGQRLWWLEQASDAELEWLYRHCQGLLAASLAEGFGLPLIEAAQRGLPVLARNLPVFREVAGDSARYFEASTPHELAQALRDWLALACRGQLPRPVAQAPSWRDSARDLARALRPVARP